MTRMTEDETNALNDEISNLKGDLHYVIEGLLIAARAVGAAEGFMYIRDEYDLVLKNVHMALKTARESGYLGKNILGSG